MGACCSCVCEDSHGYQVYLTIYSDCKHVCQSLTTNASSLGARHDGDSNICDGEAEYVMSAVGERPTNRTNGNPWIFSTCSVEYFNSYFTVLNE